MLRADAATKPSRWTRFSDLTRRDASSRSNFFLRVRLGGEVQEVVRLRAVSRQIRMGRGPALASRVRASGTGGVLDRGRTARHLQRKDDGVARVDVAARLRAGAQFQADVQARAHPGGVLAMAFRDRDVQRGRVEVLGVRTQRGRQLRADAAGGDGLLGRARLFGSGELHNEAAGVVAVEGAEESFGEVVTGEG